MTSIINIPPAPPIPVICAFSWNQNGPEHGVTYDGDSYPYTSPQPASRYKLYSTLTHQSIRFEANIPPIHDVTIIEYLWDFGDGFKGYGSVVSHVYQVADPDTSVTLSVVDSRNMRWSAAKPLNLYPFEGTFKGDQHARLGLKAQLRPVKI